MTENLPTVIELRTLVQQLERQRLDAPRLYQPAITLGIKYANDLADAIADGDIEGIQMANREMDHGPLWLRGNLSQLLSYLRIVEEPESMVLIRWDVVPDDQRAATVSLANYIVNAMRGKWSPGGRPRKSRA